MKLPGIDADRIARKLWQGADPPRGDVLKRLGFDTLVLCAAQRQHPASDFPGLKVIHAPFLDNAWPDKPMADGAARKVVAELAAGRRVYVACAAGLNRSGLVVALTLWYATGRPGVECMWQVQERRSGALFNPTFALLLFHLPPRGRARLRARA
jgi:protein-tyrosine phosphatase